MSAVSQLLHRLARSTALGGIIAALIATLIASLVAAGPADAAGPAHPRGPAHAGTAIEPMGGYVEDTACDPHTRPGTRKLAELLAHTYARYGGSSYNTTYDCGTDGTRSEHYDGRAIDWMVGVGNKRTHAAAQSAIHWLLATDSHGNRFAMARRLGVMYLIYDNRIWGAWDGRWEPYGNCAHEKGAAYANACHRTHVHISLTWNGAMGRTSYWTGRVYPTDYGPCRARGMDWAGRYTGRNLAGCPSVPMGKAGKGASPTRKALVRYSGGWAHRGSSGPMVEAVQRALHVAATGSFGTTTANRVSSFQSKHHLTRTGTVTLATWRMLLHVTH